MPTTSRSQSKPKRDRYELFIAIFKFVKSFLLLCVAIGALSLFNKNISEVLTFRVEQLGLNPFTEAFQNLLVKIGWLDKKNLTLISIGTFVYSFLFFIEGYGLYAQKRWGEWLTVIITGSFIPFEFYELFKHFTVFKIIAVILNIATVIYLLIRIRQKRKEQRHDLGGRSDK